MIQQLSSGGLITNYHCSASCKHCLYKSSPKRDKSYMEESTLRSILKKAKSLGCASFHIGGGEPFLNREGLFRVLEVMADEGVGVDYLETNASWFHDGESCEGIIDGLAARKCGTVMISVCPFHNEFIPLAKMEGVIKACQDRGMGYFLWQEQYYRHLSSLDRERTHSFEELNHIWGGDYFLKTGKRYGLTMNGRALESYRAYLPHKKAEEIVADNPGNCGELERTDHFHFDLFGNFIPPGCVGFQIAHHDLGQDLSREKYPLYRTLLDVGIGGLYEQARTEGYGCREQGYASKCDLCEDIRRFIIAERPDKIKNDLGPAEYYTMD